jgi:hypothetical protein
MSRPNHHRTADDAAQPILDKIVMEVARVEARYQQRFPAGYACPETGERSWLALGTQRTSLAYRVSPTERHHPHGDGQGVIYQGPIAVNRIAKEAERIAEAIGLFDAGLCARYLFGFGLLIGILLARIGIAA